MTKIYRIGVAGLTHDHVWGNLENIAALANACLAAVADPNQPLVDRATRQYGCTAYVDYQEMVRRESLDALYVFCDNAQGAEVGAWAAEQGLHVLVEKPMAANGAGARKLMAAAEAAGVRLMINWPVVWRPQVQAALAMATRPEFGPIWQLTHRAGHGGPEAECSPYFSEWILDPKRNGAGAIVDLCSYGINMARVLLGRPQSVTAVGAQWYDPPLPVEDNAVVVMRYPHAMATAEGAWGQVGQPITGYLATIWGARGSVTFGPGRGGRLWKTTVEEPASVEMTPPEPAPHMANGTAHFLWAIETGSEFYPLCRPAVCRDTQEVLDAAILAARDGATVTMPAQAEEHRCTPADFQP
ncbi:MAG: Gfo/Idh/MocA family oxidoreductase [Patescibacteria group bacterium]|nr:Gfo/Idh/MocA family oxidoreductase [Patescibacteria group bacterium]